jgi:hypothetical protein
VNNNFALHRDSPSLLLEQILNGKSVPCDWNEFQPLRTGQGTHSASISRNLRITPHKRRSVQEVLGTKLARRPPPVNGEEIEKEGWRQSTRNAESLSGVWPEEGLDLTSKSKPNPTCCRFLQINSWSIEKWCSLTDCLRSFISA